MLKECFYLQVTNLRLEKNIAYYNKCNNIFQSSRTRGNKVFCFVITFEKCEDILIVLLGKSNTTNLLVLMVVQFLLYEFVNIFFVNLPSRLTSLLLK